MQEKVWVVTHLQGHEIADASVFDNEVDAANYAREMSVGDDDCYKVMESVLNSREASVEEAVHWVSMPEFDAECMECVLQEVAEGFKDEEIDEFKCITFLEENKEELQKNADKIVQEYISKELREYINNERVILG
ncbi:MAG: nuclear hormone receptor family protein [Synergistaceae bacterium]|nr:nuclear hormone receptor family protein [Synergistaceae bacterium]